METLRTKSAGGVVINTDGDVLVVSQHGTSWSLPKGHIDEGETALEAARREIYEESGIRQLEFKKELGTYERYRIAKDGGDDISEFKTITIFLFTSAEMELRPVDPLNPEARWVKREGVAELLTHSKDKEFFISIAGQLP
jgi:8-oxo-dGTP pyrophosphatase MutT (NUDIX family)